MQEDLDKKRKEYVEFQKDSPVVWKTEQGTSLYLDRLASLDAQRASQRVRLSGLRAKLDAVEAALKEGRPRGSAGDAFGSIRETRPWCGGR